MFSLLELERSIFLYQYLLLGMNLRKKIIYKGNVQGVAFRWNTNDVLMGFAVTGYVKNLPDGTVELLLEGEKNELENARQAVEERMRGYWTKRKLECLPGESHWANFKIHY